METLCPADKLKLCTMLYDFSQYWQGDIRGHVLPPFPSGSLDSEGRMPSRKKALGEGLQSVSGHWAVVYEPGQATSFFSEALSSSLKQRIQMYTLESF